MLGTGLQLLYSKLGGPSGEEWKDLYSTYDDGYKDPELYKDVGRFGANTLKDVAQFFPDILTDVAQSGISQLAQTELYNPFSEAGRKRELERSDSFFPHIPGVDLPGWDVLMEPEWKYQGDAIFTDWLGEKLGTDIPTMMKDNPFENAGDNPIMDKINTKAEKETNDYFFEKNGFMTEKKWDDIYKKASEQMPEYSEWAWDNPEADVEEYDEKFADIVSQEWDNRYSDQWADFFEKSTKGQLLGKYNIGGKKTSPLREFETGINFPLPFTDKEWKSGYAWEGKPLFKYDPKRAETFEKAHGVSDLAAGWGLRKVPSKIIDRLGKRFKSSRGSDEGIMRNAERLEDKRFDWAKRWMRDQGG